MFFYNIAHMDRAGSTLFYHIIPVRKTIVYTAHTEPYDPNHDVISSSKFTIGIL